MRLLASTGRFLSRISSTRSYDVGTTPSGNRRRPSTATWQIVRRSTTTGAFHSLDKIIIENSHAALEVWRNVEHVSFHLDRFQTLNILQIAARLTREEQALLREALEDLAARQDLVSLCGVVLLSFSWSTFLHAALHLFPFPVHSFHLLELWNSFEVGGPARQFQ